MFVSMPKASESNTERSNASNEIKTIYLLTDFSEHAKNACEYAINAFGGNIQYVLMNAFDIKTSAATLIDIKELVHQESLECLEEESKRITSLFPAWQLKLISVSKAGSAIDALNYYANITPADLIVVGTKGKSKMTDLLIGSTTYRVIRNAKTPVLTIPIGAKFSKLDQFVFASELMESTENSTLRIVDALKRKFNAYISAASVRTDSKELSEQDKKLIDKLNMFSFVDEMNILSNPNITAELLHFCSHKKADLLIIVAKHTSFFKRFFHKSITKELLSHENLPILVLENN
jgi:nucleotide-binding universal stress UspA family protein